MTRAGETATPTRPDTDPVEAGEVPTERGDRAATVPTDDPEVGLAQKGGGEEAVVRRETEI
ncbi:hypothetical protein OMR07_17250 [Methylobacterium organophilum]|nr:hypothetical protein [Methylobacterium organophilum]